MLNDEIFKFINSDNELYFIISISSLFHSRPVIVFSVMIFFIASNPTTRFGVCLFNHVIEKTFAAGTWNLAQWFPAEILWHTF